MDCFITPSENHKRILTEIDIDLEEDIYETAEIISIDGDDYISILYLIGTEYGVFVILSKDRAPQSLLDEIR
jgi:hypothetical protein